MSKYGGEMGDSIFMVALSIATLYYVIAAFWTYNVYQRILRNEKDLELQLSIIFVLSTLVSMFIFLILNLEEFSNVCGQLICCDYFSIAIGCGLEFGNSKSPKIKAIV